MRLNLINGITVSFFAVIFMLAIAPINQIQAQNNNVLFFQAAKTSISFNQSFQTTLSSLNISAQPVGTSKINGNTAMIMAIDGLLDLSAGNSEFVHNGGLQFSNNQNRIQLLNLIVSTNFDPDFQEFSGEITANVVINNRFVGRMSIFDLNVKSIGVAGNGKFMINSMELTLTSEAVATFNDQFNSSIFTEEQVVGVASVKGKVK